MFLEAKNSYGNTWGLSGTRDEFIALRNILGVAQSASHSFSSTEKFVLEQVQGQIFEEICKGV